MRQADPNRLARMKMMREDQIPDFVREIAATGCDIRAVGDDAYVIADQVADSQQLTLWIAPLSLHR